jgi:SAM-dependent methyltransferase
MTEPARTNRVWSATGRQLRNPSGFAGWCLAKLMARINWTPNVAAIEALSVQPTDSVVELGFGPGRSLLSLAAKASQGTVFGFDHSVDMVRLARRKYARLVDTGRLHIDRREFSDLLFATGSIDRVLLVNVIYFFDAAGKDIAETYRILKPGGRIVIYITDKKTMARWPFCEPDTHRMFDATDATRMLVQGGFLLPDIAVQPIRLPFGIEGLVVAASKRASPTGVSHRA